MIIVASASSIINGGFGDVSSAFVLARRTSVVKVDIVAVSPTVVCVLVVSFRHFVAVPRGSVGIASGVALGPAGFLRQLCFQVGIFGFQ